MQNFQFDLDCLLAEANHRSDRDENIDVLHSRVRFFHYTNPEAAWSILRHDQLRLVDVSSMNDGSELDFYLANLGAAVGVPSSHAKSVTLETIPTMAEILSGADVRSEVQKTKKFILSDLERSIKNYPLIVSALKEAINWRDTHSVYIVSFAQAQRDYWNEDYAGIERDLTLGIRVASDLGIADDLSLWRGYASDGAGVALELGRGDLALRYAFFFDLWHVQCHLSLVRKCSGRKLINDALTQERIFDMHEAIKKEDCGPQYHSLLDTMTGAAQPPSLLGRELNLLQCQYRSGVRILRSCRQLIDDIDSALNRCFSERSIPADAMDLIVKFWITLASMHKHPGFSTEKEWRLVRIVKKSEDNPRVEVRKGIERRYIEIELGLRHDQLSNARESWCADEVKRARPLSVVLGPAMPLVAVPRDVQLLVDDRIIRLEQSRIPFLN